MHPLRQRKLMTFFFKKMRPIIDLETICYENIFSLLAKEKFNPLIIISLIYTNYLTNVKSIYTLIIHEFPYWIKNLYKKNTNLSWNIYEKQIHQFINVNKLCEEFMANFHLLFHHKSFFFLYYMTILNFLLIPIELICKF